VFQRFAAIPLLLLACQAPGPNVLEELPGPRLMQLQPTAEQGAQKVRVGSGSWARLEWYAGRRRLGSLERPVGGELDLVAGQPTAARLKIDLGSASGPALLPNGLTAEAKTLDITWTSTLEARSGSAAPQERATLRWNRRQGEAALELLRRREKGRAAGADPVFETRRAVPVALLDYGLGLDFDVEGTRTTVTEGRLSVHLEVGTERTNAVEAASAH
jgi:hypothetical protein